MPASGFFVKNTRAALKFPQSVHPLPWQRHTGPRFAFWQRERRCRERKSIADRASHSPLSLWSVILSRTADKVKSSHGVNRDKDQEIRTNWKPETPGGIMYRTCWPLFSH
jgi:hypothetical protein